MRKALLLVWLMLPVLVGFYHAGPGQEKMLLDEVAVALADGGRHAEEQQWAEAEQAYELALQLLPDDREAEGRRIRLERAKAQMHVKKLPQAHQELAGLVEELKTDPAGDKQLLAETQSALANSQYYMTWLMRLEGQPRERWEGEIEAARQTYRLLAEQASQAGDEESAQRSREDLESAIRLARMDLSDLQGLPLPSQ